MTASFVTNRETARSALWYLFEGAQMFYLPADITSAPSQPSYNDFEAWVPYLLLDFALFPIAGTVDFDATDTETARLQQLQVVMDFDSTITYTHVIVAATPALAPAGDPPPIESQPLIGFIAEPSAVTLSSTESKTYNIDITAFWS